MIITPTLSYEQFWLAAQELLGWPLDRRYAKDRCGPQQEPKIDDVVQIYWRRRVLQGCYDMIDVGRSPRFKLRYQYFLDILLIK
jgi:hypothetical protein